MTIVGARPQFIKLAPLGKELDKHFNHIVVHTGQHFDEKNMSQVFLDQMNIREPDINLAISGGNHGFQTGQMLIEIEKNHFRQKSKSGYRFWGYQFNISRGPSSIKAAYSSVTY